LAGRNGAKARGYLADAGSTPPQQVKFRIGYSPNERFALKEYLGGEGCRYPTWLRPACLCRVKKFPVPYDRFRDRVMFPITDLRGRVIAFGGPGARRRCSRQISQFAGDAALSQGGDPVQRGNGADGGPQGRPARSLSKAMSTSSRW